MNWRLCTAVAVIVVGQVAYHSAVKRFGLVQEPSNLILASYLFSTVFVIVFGTLFGRLSFAGTFNVANLVPAAFIGLSISAVELGYVYAYRSGLPLNTGALRVFAITTIVLIMIGLMFFTERPTAKLVFGCMLTVLGIWLMSSKA